jgi:hypothetical protein
MFYKELEEFRELILSKEFGEAHEVLEDTWRKNRDSVEGKILKGFINGATALQLRKLGRVESSEKVWKTFEKFMKLFSEDSPQNFFEIRNLLETNWN